MPHAELTDVAIIGGGLCGLALAHSLHARGIGWQLYEARPRLGGRVHTVRSTQGAALDLGPTWFWPDTQPQITRLVADLGLPTLPQADDGSVLLLDDPNRPPRTLALADGRLAEGGTPQPGAVHGGAQRLAGGMAALIDALAARLPTSRVHLGHALTRLRHDGEAVSLQVQHAGKDITVHARHVVLCLPPRLAQHALAFDPPLPVDLSAALARTRTWMASAAKAAVVVAKPFWRDSGASGNAWVTHPQAVLGEVFDASAPQGPGVLAGFCALPAAQRGAFARSLPLLVDSQLSMLFGSAAHDGEQHHMDWAAEPLTCTPADLADDGAAEHPHYGEPLLAQPHWNGRLLFGGSETAAHGGGYLEGALTAAARLRRQLAERFAAQPAPAAAHPR